MMNTLTAQRRINWHFVVCEAKKRRLEGMFTQERSAKIAGVSTPTLSKFENEKNISVGSALKILGIFGLSDESNLQRVHGNKKKREKL